MTPNILFFAGLGVLVSGPVAAWALDLAWLTRNAVVFDIAAVSLMLSAIAIQTLRNRRQARTPSSPEETRT